MEYKTLNHSKFLLLYHIILVCKYRHKLLVKTGDFIISIIKDISNNYDFKVETIETDKDHIHILISSVPKLSPKSIVRMIKQITTYQVWVHYESYLSKYLWKEKTFWSDGYFVCSIGNASESTIRTYIESQG